MPTTSSPSISVCCSEKPTWSTNIGSSSATALANAGSLASNCWPIDAHCEP
ncbi:Uncharacterised protein [Mycobacterium tuberculosis]|uniref:Uncharacterized protein n=1 Tax=Mycobacterium tuberculosis TaxID=1773 RepID=A0A0U0TY61_MYCTX|nr:Uncharacterised protein [Mycobacterium tuberculosis]COX85848.1 Uncharacterised protein [Mycobacterium tuberculosis]COY28051.1 Uncharacterised protein [Mycobacterium tuberculosis]SGO48505.1 Uncharacterised protein [Mycobacterium tuberculosis]